MKIKTGLILFGLHLMAALSASAADNRVFELRTYYAADGKLDELQARFRDHTVALFEKHGMENIGYWVPVDNSDNKLIYLMAYPDRAARDRMWKAFMEDPEWQAVYRASVEDGRLVTRVESQFFTTTDYSPAIRPEKADAPRLFELRVYHTNPGKLDDLNARFRDHTLEIFTRNGMTNVGYWLLMDDQEGHEDTLTYLLAFPDGESRDAAWKAFGQDPAWKQAYQASVKDGRLVNKVDSTQMVPTDFSPTR